MRKLLVMVVPLGSLYLASLYLPGQSTVDFPARAQTFAVNNTDFTTITNPLPRANYVVVTIPAVTGTWQIFSFRHVDGSVAMVPWGGGYAMGPLRGELAAGQVIGAVKTSSSATIVQVDAQSLSRCLSCRRGVFGAGSTPAEPPGETVPTPDFLITADSDSVDYSGDGSGPCSVTTAVLEEHPASSGLYAVAFNGSSGTVTCGTGLDQLHTGTIVAFVDHDAFGENSAGMILSKTAGGLSADRAWLFHVSDTNDRMQFSYYNNTGGSRGLVSPTDSADPFADYTCVAISWTVSTLASLAGQHYIAGSPVTTSQIDAGGSNAADDDASHTVVVGNTLGDNFTWNGHIGFPLRVWRSVLSDSQVAAVCAQGRS